MNDEKPIKFFTWKHRVYLGAALIIGIALGIYCNYERKGYFDRSDLLIAILTIATGTVIFIALAFHANRPEKGK